MKIIKIASLTFLLLAIMNAAIWAFQITSPPQYTEVHPGDVVLIRVELSPGETVGGIYFDTFSKFISNPPYEYQYKIGPDQLGTINIAVIAIKPASEGPFASADNAVASTADLYLKSTLSSSVKVTSYSVDPPAHFALLLKPTAIPDKYKATQEQISVYGLYSDGIKREIARAVDGSTYSSSDEKIVTVSIDGLATAVGLGKAKITVRNGSFKTIIDVLVVKGN
jgi:hypothetical protein